MTFATLAVISLIAVLGSVLALPPRWHIPVVVGELLAGIAVGLMGLGWLDASDVTLTFLAQIGFVLVMFVAGTHVPVHDPHLRAGIRIGALRAVAVGVIAAVLGVVIARAFGTGHAALYAVLMASSSAALILPIVSSLRLGASLDFAQLFISPSFAGLGLALGVGPARRSRRGGHGGRPARRAGSGRVGRADPRRARDDRRHRDRWGHRDPPGAGRGGPRGPQDRPRGRRRDRSPARRLTPFGRAQASGGRASYAETAGVFEARTTAELTSKGER